MPNLHQSYIIGPLWTDLHTNYHGTEPDGRMCLLSYLLHFIYTIYVMVQSLLIGGVHYYICVPHYLCHWCDVSESDGRMSPVSYLLHIIDTLVWWLTVCCEDWSTIISAPHHLYQWNYGWESMWRKSSISYLFHIIYTIIVMVRNLLEGCLQYHIYST